MHLFGILDCQLKVFACTNAWTEIFLGTPFLEFPMFLKILQWVHNENKFSLLMTYFTALQKSHNKILFLCHHSVYKTEFGELKKADLVTSWIWNSILDIYFHGQTITVVQYCLNVCFWHGNHCHYSFLEVSIVLQ